MTVSLAHRPATATSAQPRAGSLAVRQLAEVYRELERVRRAARSGTAPGADGVRRELVELFARQAAEAQTLGADYVADVYHPVRDLLAAFADEFLERLDWPGRQAWTASPLAAADFAAGEDPGQVVLGRMESLLTAPASAARSERARVDYLALSLGFRGGERGPGGDARIAELRRGLFVLIFGREPQPAEALGRLTPEAYRHTLSGGERELLPELRGWLLALVAAALVLLALSFPLWWHATGELDDAVERALEWSEGTP